MTRYVSSHDLPRLLKLKTPLAEEAVHTVMPVFAKGKVMYPLRKTLEAVMAYADAHEKSDGYIYKKSKYRRADGTSERCEMWGKCRDRMKVYLEQLDAEREQR